MTAETVTSAPPARPCPPRRIYYKSILVLAILPRLAMLYYVLTRYPQGWLYTKGMELGILGRLLCLKQGFNSPFGGSTGPTAFLAPGYPFVVSMVFRVFGIYTPRSAAAVLLLHIVFSLATAALVMKIAGRIATPRAANIAGLWWALSPTLIWTPVIFWDTSASMLLLTGMVALALHISQRPSLLLWSAAGLYCGLTMLINPSLTLALLAILGWTAFQTGRSTQVAVEDRPHPLPPRVRPAGHLRSGGSLRPTARNLAAALLVLLAVFAPWPVRNARRFHAFIPFRTNLGYELWNGNQPGGDGKFVDKLHPMLSRAQYREYAAMGEIAYMRQKADLGKASIRAHKAEFLRVTAWRIQAFWLGLAQGSDPNSSLVTMHAVLTTCLGFAGLLLLWKQDRSLAWIFLLPLVLFPVPYYLTHPDFRFRLLLDPILTVLAAYALNVAWNAWRHAHPEQSPSRQVWR